MSRVARSTSHILVLVARVGFIVVEQIDQSNAQTRLCHTVDTSGMHHDISSTYFVPSGDVRIGQCYFRQGHDKYTRTRHT